MERILIIAGGLHIGGAERIAANICCYAPLREFEFHYVVFEGYDNVYGPEIEAHGGKVFTLPSPRSGYLRYCRLLAALIRKYRYSAVHSHTQFNSGINLLVAKLMRVPIRIAHSHTTKTEGHVSAAQKIYERALRHLIRNTSTHLLACGVEAGAWMFGENVFESRGVVLRNGIDVRLNQFSEEHRAQMRQYYEIPQDAFVVGHAGTLLPVKNQEFLIRLMPEILAVRPNSFLLLLGADEQGELLRLTSVAQECGVVDSVIFAGGIRNVNEALSAMDVFAFPSLREGTPLALLEAQANGLPCVVSDRIPGDAFLTDLVQALPLSDRAAWIAHLVGAKRHTPERYSAELEESGYDYHSSYQPLYSIYRSIATVSLSFDDGRGDNTALLDDILIPSAVPATINITTGYIDGTCPMEYLPSEKAPMRKEDLLRFAKQPSVEIALHGDRHLNTPEDILSGRKKLISWLDLTEDAVLGFASPNSGLSPACFQSGDYDSVRSRISYVRISLRIQSKYRIRTVCRKVARIIHSPLLYRIAYHDTIMTACDGKLLYSIPIMGDITVKQVLSVVRDSIKQRGALVLMFHSVETDPQKNDSWSWKQEKMETLCAALLEYQRNGLLSLCTTEEQMQLIKNRT